MKLPRGLNHLLTVLYLHYKGVKWKGEIPVIDMLRPPRFCLNGSGKIVLGSGVKIFTDLGRTLFQIADGATITIGDRAVLNGVHWVHCKNQITIGPDALIGAGVRIIDSKAHPVHPGDNQEPQSVWLGRNCLIGMGSSILPGVRIGEHSMVGADSVVTKDVPLKTVVAGNPARTIRTFECPPDWIRRK